MQVSKDPIQLPIGVLMLRLLYTYIHTHYPPRYVREMEITDVSNVTELHEQLVDSLYRRIMEVNEQIYAEELARQEEKGYLPFFFTCLQINT